MIKAVEKTACIKTSAWWKSTVGKVEMSSMNEIQLVVLFFAHLKKKPALPRLRFCSPEGASVADLKTHLVGLYPQLELAMPHVVVAVNRHFAPDDQVLVHGAEVAFFPPVSGGAESRTVHGLSPNH